MLLLLFENSLIHEQQKQTKRDVVHFAEIKYTHYSRRFFHKNRVEWQVMTQVIGRKSFKSSA